MIEGGEEIEKKRKSRMVQEKEKDINLSPFPSPILYFPPSPLPPYAFLFSYRVLSPDRLRLSNPSNVGGPTRGLGRMKGVLPVGLTAGLVPLSLSLPAPTPAPNATAVPFAVTFPFTAGFLSSFSL